MWWAHRAGSWIRLRWRSAYRVPCCRSCAGRRRWPTRWRCPKGWSSLAGRRELPMMSADPVARARAAAFMGKRMVETAAGRGGPG